MYELRKPPVPWIQDQYDVVLAGAMAIGCVGLVCGKWFCVAENSCVDIEMHFDTKEQAANALIAAVFGPKRETPALRIVR